MIGRGKTSTPHLVWDDPPDVDVPTRIDQWHDPEIVAIDATIRVSVDGRRVNAFTDPMAIDLSLRIILRCTPNSTAEFERIEIEEFKGASR